MKRFHWGHGVAIFYSLFVLAWIGVLFQSKKTPVNLVQKDYYEADLGFQKILDARAAGKDVLIKLAPDGQSLELTFPESLKGKRLAGELKFLRPSDPALDFSQKFETPDGQPVVVQIGKRPAGLWRVSVDGQAEGAAFLRETALTLL